MALSSRALVRVPPDGAGKAIYAHHLRYVEYHSAVDPDPFAVDDIIVGASSTTTGRVVYVLPSTSTTGLIVVAFNDLDAIDGNFETGEDLQVGGSTRAAVASQEAIYVSKTEVVGANNPANGQSVDNQGNAHIRFQDGQPALDVYGKTKVSPGRSLGMYSFRYDKDEDSFGDIIVGNASSDHDPQTGAAVISTGPEAGNVVIKRTNWDHVAQPGAAMSCVMGVAVSGIKDEAEIRWGMADSFNGLGFGVGSNGFGLGFRTDVSGTVEDVEILQPDFNRDRLDGTGPSGFDIDVTKINIYFMDYQWMGSGEVVFGVYHDGTRIVCHVESLNNTSSLPFIRYGSLPLGFSIQNTAPVGSTTELRVWSASVDTERAMELWAIPYAASAPPVTIDDTDGWVPLLTIRSEELHEGQRNGIWSGIEAFDGCAVSPDFETDRSVCFKAVFDLDLDGAVWGPPEPSEHGATEIDTSATLVDAAQVDEHYTAATWLTRGCGTHVFPSKSPYDAEGVGLYADDDPATLTIVAKVVHPGQTAVVNGVLRWNDVGH